MGGEESAEREHWRVEGAEAGTSLGKDAAFDRLPHVSEGLVLALTIPTDLLEVP